MSVEVEDTEAEGSGSSGKRLSDAEFAEAKELYELGKSGLGELAEAYGISRQALSRRLKAAGSVKSSRAHEAAAAAAKAAAGTPSASVAKALERYADKRADWIEETRLEGVAALKQARMLARKIVADHLKGAAPGAPVTLAAIDDDLKAVQRLNKILCDNLNTSLDILRANDHVDEEDLPSLIIEDLTNEEILQHHKNTGALPEDTTVEEMLAEEMELGEI